jgi:hypothetical protein
MGIFDWISDKVGDVYHSVKQKVGEILPTLPKTIAQWSRGEYHAPGGYSYCGPGTKLDSAGKPINAADSACMAHDYEYDSLAKNRHKISQDDFNRMIRESDQKLIEDIDRSGQQDLGALMSRWGIKGKMVLEDLGILSRDRFVTP